MICSWKTSAIDRVFSIFSFNNQMHIIGSSLKPYYFILMKYNPLTNNWISVNYDRRTDKRSPGNVTDYNLKHNLYFTIKYGLSS